MNSLNYHFCTFALALLSLAQATRLPAQTLTTLASFNGQNGDTPQYASLAKGSDGNFYGVTYQGGANNLGTIFKVTPSGVLTTIYNFASSNLWSSQPTSTLLLANDGNFYGTTMDGGVCDCGILFRVTPGGAMTVVYEFATTNGAFDSNAPTNPIGGVIQGTDGYLYGTATYGGAHASGAIYRVSLSGVESVIHSFAVTQTGTAGAAGWQPVGRLIQGTDSNLYGVTASGGFNGRQYLQHQSQWPELHHTAQFQHHGRLVSRCRPDSGHRREFLRHGSERRLQLQGRYLQNDSVRRVHDSS